MQEVEGDVGFKEMREIKESLKSEMKSARDGFQGAAVPVSLENVPEADGGPGSFGSRHLLTVEELADYLGVPRSWIYEHARKRSIHRIPGIKLGKYWRFRLGDVLAWLDRQGNNA